MPLTDGTSDKQPITASEGTPLLSDRADEGAHQLVGDASGSDPSVERGEVSTLDGEDFVDLGSNEIIKELEPERWGAVGGGFTGYLVAYRHDIMLHACARCHICILLLHGFHRHARMKAVVCASVCGPLYCVYQSYNSS